MAGSKWYRMPMALLLGLAGITLLFFGLKGGENYFAFIGVVFIICALLSCLIIRKAERTISKVNEDIEKIMEAVNKGADDSPDKI